MTLAIKNANYVKICEFASFQPPQTVLRLRNVNVEAVSHGAMICSDYVELSRHYMYKREFMYLLIIPVVDLNIYR